MRDLAQIAVGGFDVTEVADRLRALIDRQGISQSEVGRRMGRSQRWVSNRVLGDRELKAAELPEFAEALRIPVADLCRFLFEDQPSAAPLSVADATAELAAALTPLNREVQGRRMLEDLAPEIREIVRETVREVMTEVLKGESVTKPSQR